MAQIQAGQEELSPEFIKEKLRRFLLENFASAGDVRIEDDHSLLQLGIIDSLSLVNIISYIEEEFDIKVSPKDFFPGKFDTIAKAADYIVNQRRRCST
ncbi:MAG: acyl carrier protein [Desulfobacterales bacterium]|nr:MAG: acyl carrier protein [Desulfobacterales bacterium]